MTQRSFSPKAAAVTRLAAVLASVLVLAPFARALAAAGAAESVSIRHNRQDPRVGFAVGELRLALQEAGYRVVDSSGDWTVTFDTFRPGLGPQSFRIRREGEREIRVVGGDSLGAMYGGLELAETFQLAGEFQGVVEKARKPYLLHRGIKFNIPLDARAPSYDFQFSPEGCIDNRGFLSLEQFFQHPPLVGSGILSVQEYAQAVVEGRPADGITPMEVAGRLDRLAAQSLAGAEKLSQAAVANKELNATLTDIRAMAHLGRYYADKIRGAAHLAVFRADGKRKEFRQRAAAYLTKAVEHWPSLAQP